MSGFLQVLVEPGFLSSDTVRQALVVGAVVAVVTGTVGTFTVLRKESFAGHALGELGTAGGPAASLAGFDPLWGFLGIAVAAGGVIEGLGARRPRRRDLATGLVLGAGLGLAALLLYLNTQSSTATGTSVAILFGSLFAGSGSMVLTVVGLGGLSLAMVLACYRMLLLGSVDLELAAVRGVKVRLVGMAYLAALALAVALAAYAIGAVLATALLVGPPATALKMTKRPGLSLAAAAVVGVLATWLGILLAYDSYYWPPAHRGWPVSFFVVALVFVFYVAGDVFGWARGRGAAGGRS